MYGNYNLEFNFYRFTIFKEYFIRSVIINWHIIKDIEYIYYFFEGMNIYIYVCVCMYVYDYSWLFDTISIKNFKYLDEMWLMRFN